MRWVLVWVALVPLAGPAWADGLVADCQTDNAPVLRAMLARGAEVRLPAGCYALASVVGLPGGARLIGEGQPVLVATGGTGTLLRVQNAADVMVAGLVLDSRKDAHPRIAAALHVSGVRGVQVVDVELRNPTGEIHVADSANVSVLRPVVTGSLLHGVLFHRVQGGVVQGGRFEGNVGFGVILRGGTNGVLVAGNQTTRNGIELVGVEADSWGNRIEGNHAEGTGDNGISVTGWDNVVAGNVVRGCQGNGIGVYGSGNVVEGNTAVNNAQGFARQPQWRAGIAVQGGFGGTGQRNVVRNNVLDDDQAVPTQRHGVWVGRALYRPWRAGEAVPGGAWRLWDGALWRAGRAGATAGTGPDRDTGVAWRRVRDVAAVDGNQVYGNRVARAGAQAVVDEGRQ